MNTQVDNDKFQQKAAGLQKDVADAVQTGLQKLALKRRTNDDEAMRIIAGIPLSVAYAIEQQEPEKDAPFTLSILVDVRWKQAYKAGHMPYDTTTSVVIEHCRAAGLNPVRVETESGWDLQITVNLGQPKVTYEVR